MRIIPAIDIIEGKCVRLTQGDYTKKVIYNDDPLQQAQQFEEMGLKDLHLVDLDGAKNSSVTNWKTVELIASNTNLNVDFGGGIKTETEIEKLFQAGVKQVNLGSIAVKRPRYVSKWIKKYGSKKIILSADVKNANVVISGWKETSVYLITELLNKYIKFNIEYVTCTDVSRDGMLNGPNFELYKKLLDKYPRIKLIASGGVRSIDDLIKLDELGVEGVIIGKAYYEGRIKPKELMTFIADNPLPERIPDFTIKPNI